MDVLRCFICDLPCVKKCHGSKIANTLSMPLTAVLAKCLRVVADIENEYFCKNCADKIGEYDKLLLHSRQIENELNAQFQNKLMKYEDEDEIQDIKPIFIQTSDEDINFEHTNSETINANQTNGKNQKSTKNKTKVKKAKPATKPNYKIEFSCVFCDRVYKTKGALKVHIIQHCNKNAYGKNFHCFPTFFSFFS